MATKYKKHKIKGVTVVEKITKKERQPFPRPTVFKDRSKYDRKESKKELRNMLY